MPALILVLACLLGMAHILAAISAETRIRGPKWNAGPRDTPAPDMPPLIGRLRRAQANFFETFPIFVALWLGCMVLGILDWRVMLGGWVYLAMRAIYLPLYAYGIPNLRTLIWAVSMLGLVLLCWAVLLP